MSGLISRRVASTPVRTAAATWKQVVELLVPSESSPARVELMKVRGVACASIASSLVLPPLLRPCVPLSAGSVSVAVTSESTWSDVVSALRQRFSSLGDTIATGALEKAAQRVEAIVAALEKRRASAYPRAPGL